MVSHSIPLELSVCAAARRPRYDPYYSYGVMIADTDVTRNDDVGPPALDLEMDKSHEMLPSYHNHHISYSFRYWK